MKKLWLVVALVTLGGLASNTFADVQNIRLSGDIRVRGYFLSNVAGDEVEDQARIDDSFISQRTRVTIEADLEDHVLVVVTLKAEGLWGADNDANESSGAGTGESGPENQGFGSDGINRRWEVGVTEAYVQLNEVFYTPATLKLGRQYLHYGRGLILSSVEQEYNYDAARLVLDYYPMTLDLVYAKVVENTPFGAGTGARDADLFFANARYEMSDSLIKNVELYFGYLANNESASTSDTRVPPARNGASPLIIGLRSDMSLTEGLTTWVEGAYEFGSAAVGDNISAFLVNAGGRYALKDIQWSPVVNVNYTYASGGGTDGENAFRPWFDYVEGYNGYLFAPMLSNIHIFNLGASVKPYENTTLSVQGYYYLLADKTPGQPGIGIVSNRNIDFGGVGFSPSGSSRELGWEIDTILGYDYSKDVRCQLVYAAFIPENDFNVFPSDSVAHEVRGEINVKF